MKITENSTVTLTVLVALVGGVLWLASIDSKATIASDGVMELKAEKIDIRKDISEIKQGIARIEGKLDK